MPAKKIKSRSINITISLRTYNDLHDALRDVEDARMDKKAQRRATLLRHRLERAPQSMG